MKVKVIFYLHEYWLMLNKTFVIENNIKFMRISSDIFPFATHEKAG
jgi:UV DNA damage repair endonuclease